MPLISQTVIVFEPPSPPPIHRSSPAPATLDPPESNSAGPSSVSATEKPLGQTTLYVFDSWVDSTTKASAKIPRSIRSRNSPRSPPPHGVSSSGDGISLPDDEMSTGVG